MTNVLLSDLTGADQHVFNASQYNFVMLWFVCQDKEEKEKLMVSKAAVEESDKEGCNSGGEEIIELQEMRMSPIPSLRNRHKQKYYKDPRGEVSQIFS